MLLVVMVNRDIKAPIYVGFLLVALHVLHSEREPEWAVLGLKSFLHWGKSAQGQTKWKKKKK